MPLLEPAAHSRGRLLGRASWAGSLQENRAAATEALKAFGRLRGGRRLKRLTTGWW
jgi:tagatose-1,6-bisphosphate aldolase